jgi:excisionase family DNA binding protein
VTMDKEQAAKFLGVSVRTLQRHTAAGRISAKYSQGERGPQAEYSRAELEKFKAELAHTGGYVRPAVMGDAPESGAAALAPIRPNYAEHLAQALDALKEALRPAAAPVPLSDKLMLTLAEAAQLSGLSRRYLRGAIAKQRLKARIIGKGFKVKRADLEGFIRNL